jgi:hypothetical protein
MDSGVMATNVEEEECHFGTVLPKTIQFCPVAYCFRGRTSVRHRLFALYLWNTTFLCRTTGIFEQPQTAGRGFTLSKRKSTGVLVCFFTGTGCFSLDKLIGALRVCSHMLVPNPEQ